MTTLGSVTHTYSPDRRKGREIQSNDDLLYDPEDDDANEDWVGEQLRGIISKIRDINEYI